MAAENLQKHLLFSFPTTNKCMNLLPEEHVKIKVILF